MILRLCIGRLAMGVVTIIIVSVIVFASVEMLPGDFARYVLGQAATPETIQAFQDSLGLNQPPIQRYFVWLGSALTGDFGNSYSGLGSLTAHTQSVASLVLPRLANTLFLAVVTAIIAVPASLVIGFIAALFRGGIFDRLIKATTLSAISAPEFLTAYILIYVFSIRFQLLDPIASVSDDMTLASHLKQSILPIGALLFATLGHMIRMTRAALIGVISSTFVETARLKGLSPLRIMSYHAAPNAWAPVVAVIASNLAYLIAGVVVIEVVFAYPGAGSLMVDAVTSRNIPVVQACGLVFAAVYIVLNIVADVLTIIGNPRLLHAS